MGSPLRAGLLAWRIQSCCLQHRHFPGPPQDTVPHGERDEEADTQRKGRRRRKTTEARSLLQVPRTELFPCGDSLNGRAPECFLDGLRSPKGRGHGPGPGLMGDTALLPCGAERHGSSGHKQTLCQCTCSQALEGSGIPNPRPFCLAHLACALPPARSYPNFRYIIRAVKDLMALPS